MTNENRVTLGATLTAIFIAIALVGSLIGCASTPAPATAPLGQATAVPAAQPTLLATPTSGAAPTEVAPASSSGKTVYLKWLAATTTGTWYPIGARIGAELEKRRAGVKVAMAPGGGFQNCIDVNRGDAQLGWAYSADISAAYQGVKPYDKPQSNVRHVATMYNLPLLFVVRANSSINGWADLKGKRFNAAPVTYGSYQLCGYILEAFGMTFDDIRQSGGRVDTADMQATIDNFKDGQLDAFANFVTPDAGNLKDLQFVPEGVRFVGIEDDKIKQILDKHPEFVVVTIPAGVAGWKDHKKDIKTLAGVAQVFASKDVSEDIIYDLTKTLWETVADWKTITSAAAGADIKFALDAAMAPLHPGAMKYYKEKGLDVSKVKVQ
ncbi:MAG: TAXI family TRAP transporter solute-binding subunit [Chloroflexota bacterium]